MCENKFIKSKRGKLLERTYPQSRKNVMIQLFTFIVGVLFIIFGFLLNEIFPSIVKMMIGRTLMIVPNNSILSDFITIPVPIYMQFYMFNVTNPQAILEGEKPALREIGPFTYLEKRHKHNLSWTGDTVEYLENTKFFFVPEMSNGLTEDFLITTLNPIMISVASKLADLETSFDSLLHASFELTRQRFNLDVFITRKVGELLFKGYEEDFLSEAYKFTQNPLHKMGRFGFLQVKNDSDDGKYSVFTGSSGLESLQVIDKFKGSKTLGFWSNPYCDMINGTTGMQTPLPVSIFNKIYIFASDICRSIYLTFEKKLSYKGLKLFRYGIPYELLGFRAENECFCKSRYDFTCQSSLINLSPCRDGVPVIASLPHFYMGDKDTIMAVGGLNPNKDDHETYLDVEPNTGVSIRITKRIQFNMHLKPYVNVPDLVNVTSIIFPLFWANESAEVSDAIASQLQDQLTTPFKISEWVIYSLCALGAICVMIAIVFMADGQRRQFHEHVKDKAGESQPVLKMSFKEENGELSYVPVANYAC